MSLKINLPSGNCVLAVSGGVDSMVLLDLLNEQSSKKQIVVAHFNHGIRPDADKDEKFVERTAKKLKLQYEVGYGTLGPKASEETARNARYAFLKRIQKKHKSSGIITAHHQDDLIESAVINVLRGTGRKGITAIGDNKSIYRPLLNIKKEEIIRYARENDVEWREDESNKEEKYLRNLIRNKLSASLTDEKRQKLISNYDKVAEINNELNEIIATLSQELIQKNTINRDKYISLPHDAGKEVLMWWLSDLKITHFDRKLIEKMDMVLRTAKTSTKHAIGGNYWLIIETDRASIATPN